MAFLNHAGTSWPKPPCVHEAVARAQDCEPAGWAANFRMAHRRVAAKFGIAATRQLQHRGVEVTCVGPGPEGNGIKLHDLSTSTCSASSRAP